VVVQQAGPVTQEEEPASLGTLRIGYDQGITKLDPGISQDAPAWTPNNQP
jgi:hypothetical protein